jgi:aspartyl-tRNA(Asn)/glutamyl-tRNA(Gln) amidotransferase subunit C
MSIDQNTIARAAHLARIRIDEADTEALGERLNEILSMVDRLQQADVDGIEPLAHPLEASQPLRADEVSEPDVRDKVLKLAPAEEGGCFLVPRVIE